jgi:hypothetical protein
VGNETGGGESKWRSGHGNGDGKKVLLWVVGCTRDVGTSCLRCHLAPRCLAELPTATG